MSRVAKAPVSIPAGVEVTLNEQTLTVKGAKGSLTRVINNAVNVVIEDGVVKFFLLKALLTLGHRLVLLVH